MAQQRLSRTNQDSIDKTLAAIDGNFDDLFDVLQILNADFVLQSQTAAQQMFNASPNGALNVLAGLYEFWSEFSLTGMSASSGNFGFAFGGTATISSQAWWSKGIKSSPLSTQVALYSEYNTAAQLQIALVSTGTVGAGILHGFIRLSAGGSLIPQVSLTVAAAATLKANSWFKLKKHSSNYQATLIQPPQPNFSQMNWS